MPLYEYRCEKCGKIKEFIQKFSDDPVEICPDCSGKLTKLISKSSFHLKGSGWYVTDYKDGKSSASPEKAPKKEETKAEKSAASCPMAKAKKSENKKEATL